MTLATTYSAIAGAWALLLASWMPRSKIWRKYGPSRPALKVWTNRTPSPPSATSKNRPSCRPMKASRLIQIASAATSRAVRTVSPRRIARAPSTVTISSGRPRDESAGSIRASAARGRKIRIARPSGDTAAQQPSGQVPGMAVVAQQHLAVDDGGHHADGFLAQAFGPGGQIGNHLGHGGADRLRIEDHDIGRHALAQQPAIMEAPMGGGVVGDEPHRFFEGERPALAHPMAQEMRLQRIVHDLRDMGAGVGEGHDRARMLHHFERLVLIFIGDRLNEKELQVARRGELDHEIDRIDLALARAS